VELEFKYDHLSIEQFNSVNMSNFSVLTGVNGSGKSHLLEAIKKKHVVFTGCEEAKIVLFNYESFKLDEESPYNAEQLTQEREKAWKDFNGSLLTLKNLRTELGEKYKILKEKCQKENILFLDLDDKSLNNYKKLLYSNVFNHNKENTNPSWMGLLALAKKLPYSLDEITFDNFNLMYKPYLYKNNFLPRQLGRIFWDYHIKHETNQFNEYKNDIKGEKNKILNEQEFINANGQKPWDIINEILLEFGSLRYKVMSPEDNDYFGSYQLKLVHTGKENIDINFTSLSSGEKTLMALVASIYKSSSDLHFPDILLLDEVDASLHPSMINNMLNVIERVFLKHGVKVILVTHSPTTIALAPEESIFVMNPTGLNRIEKKSRSEALAILTQGFVTIDQGLSLFDQVSKTKITIITEGKNTVFIKRALELKGINDIEVLSDCEGISGKNQLKTLFEFFSKAIHSTKVIFVWDCDVDYKLEESNNTYSIILSKNLENTIAKKGIENIFPSYLFKDYTVTLKRANGNVTVKFDSNCKRDFEAFILDRNNSDDFIYFNSLFDEIKKIKKTD